MARPKLSMTNEYSWFVNNLEPLSGKVEQAKRDAEVLIRAARESVRRERNALIVEAHTKRGLSRNAICRALGITSGAKQIELWDEVFDGTPWQSVSGKRHNPATYLEAWGWKAEWEINWKAKEGEAFATVRFVDADGDEFEMVRKGPLGRGTHTDWPLKYRWDYDAEKTAESWDANMAKVIQPLWCDRLLDALRGDADRIEQAVAELREFAATEKAGPWPMSAPYPRPAEPEQVTPYRDELDELDDVPLVVEQVSPDDAEF